MEEVFAIVGFWRRLLIILYDYFLIYALFLFCTAVALALNHGHELNSTNLAYRISLLAAAGCFYVGFWYKKGQTLGMRAWQCHIQRLDGRPVSFFDALTRFFLAMVSNLCFGLGLIWQIFDPKGLTLYDRLTGTVLLTRRKKA